MISYLHGGHLLWVEAITHQHAERVSHSPQHSYSLCVRHSQQAVVVHLQDTHAHLQAAISCCCTDWTHLFEYEQRTCNHDMTIIVSVHCKAVSDNLGDEDTFICGIKGVSCMTLGPPTNANAKFLAWLLLDYHFLQQHKHSLSTCCYLLLALPNLLLLGVLPASQVAMGPFVPACGSPAYWPKERVQLPGVWRGGGRWNSLPIFGLQHAARFDLQDHEESPDGGINHGQWVTWQD